MSARESRTLAVAAARVFTRRLGAHVAITAAASIALCGLAFAWRRTTDAARGHGHGPMTPQQLGWVLLATGLAFALWSTCATLQRALVIALDGPAPVSSPRAAMASVFGRRALLPLGAILGLANAMAQCAAVLVGLVGTLGRVVAPSAFFGLGFTVWLASRALTGIAIAIVVREGGGAFAALRASIAGLRAHRGPSLFSRVALVPPAAASIAVFAIVGGNSAWPWVVLAVASALVATRDGAAEAAWHTHLRAPKLDADATARVFE